MKSRLMRISAVAALGAAVLVGCSKSDDSARRTTAAGANGLPPVAAGSWVDETGKASVVIDTRDNSFNPENIVVSPGTKITFENKGRNPHNVIPVNKGEFEEVPVSKLQPKDSASISISDEGEFPYYCSLHGTPKAGMKGRIKVAKR